MGKNELIDESQVFKAENHDPIQRLQMQLLRTFAEFEANIRQQATREGIAARKANPE